MLIEVFSDVVCPWCYVGERRLAAALAARPEMEVTLHWRPFQLRPEMAAEGMPWEQMINEKFGGLQRARPMFDQLRHIGAQCDIDFRWDRVARSPNTLDAHRLILRAREEGREWEMADALFAAYFSEGRDLNDRAQLVAIAAAAGMDGASTSAFLGSEMGREAVMQSQQEAYASGIHSVPSYMIDRRYLIQGAQESRLFVRALDQIAGAGEELRGPGGADA